MHGTPHHAYNYHDPFFKKKIMKTYKVWGIIFLIKAHSECRRQRVLSRNETNTKACANKHEYNRNWCTSDSLGVQQWVWLL